MKNYKEWLNESYSDAEISYNSSRGYYIETDNIIIQLTSFGNTSKNDSIVYSAIPQEAIDVIKTSFKDTCGIRFFINWNFPRTEYGENIVKQLSNIKFDTVLITNKNEIEYVDAEKLVKADEKSFEGLFYIYYNDDSEKICFLNIEALIFMINKRYLPIEFAQVIYKNNIADKEDNEKLTELLHKNRGKILGNKFNL